MIRNGMQIVRHRYLDKYQVLWDKSTDTIYVLDEDTEKCLIDSLNKIGDELIKASDTAFLRSCGITLVAIESAPRYPDPPWTFPKS